MDWFETTEASHWQNFVDVRQTFGHSDIAKVDSGHTATIFDIGGNKYRLMAAVHHNAGVVYAMMVLTCKEYAANKWKARL